MSDKFAGKYRISSPRLQNWNYASAGLYFVTICTRDKEPWFGEICDRVVKLSDIGELVDNLWIQVPKQFPNVYLDEYVIMQDHIHGILGIGDAPVIKSGRVENERSRDAINRVSTNGSKLSVKPGGLLGGITGESNPMLNQSLGTFIRWFKGRATNDIRKSVPQFHWQPRYHDRIIRNETELDRIRRYIYENPARWDPNSENEEWGSWYKGELWV